MENKQTSDSLNSGEEEPSSEEGQSGSDSQVPSNSEMCENSEDVESEVEDEGEENEASSKDEKMVWRNDERPLKSDEELQLAPGCYDMLHRITLDWSCLSFDVLKDDLGAFRVNFPLECYVVAGTQPGTKKGMESSLHVMKWSNLTKNFGEEDDDEEDEECVFRVSTVKHTGIVNRVKSCPQSNKLVCSMSDTCKVHMWDVAKQLEEVDSDNKDQKPQKGKLLHTCNLHKTEGYAVSWSPLITGKLVTGSCDGTVVMWDPVQGGWEDFKFLKLETSVEDLKWSYTEPAVFFAASCDGMLRLFDTREKKVSKEVSVSETDLNTISLNPSNKNLVLTGSEDGSMKVYDLRFTQLHFANLKWHKKAVTCVDWHPLDSSVCAASCRDDSISIWDISLEPETNSKPNVPDQMLFLHMGQTDITEFMFHRNMPGVVISTALDGFNVFKTVNVD